jgi:hypothetical protein
VAQCHWSSGNCRARKGTAPIGIERRGMKGGWQMHRGETPAAKRNRGGSIAGVQRMDLLSWRFSRAEIDRLSKLQLDYRERPDVLDLPIEEGRLRFARWLVEHGRLTEDDRVGSWKPPRHEETWCGKGPQRSRPKSAGDIPHRGSDGEPELAGTRRQEREEWCLDRLGVWSWVRRGLAKAAQIGRKLGSWLFLPGRGDPRGPYDPYGGAFPYLDAQWNWMYLRPPW